MSLFEEEFPTFLRRTYPLDPPVAVKAGHIYLAGVDEDGKPYVREVDASEPMGFYVGTDGTITQVRTYTDR